MKMSHRFLLMIFLFALLTAPLAHAQVGDRDGDGVGDDVDQCISDPGPASLLGCPGSDVDNDRTEDSVDACPGVPGIPENNGCPVGGTDSTGGTDSSNTTPTAPQLNTIRPPEDTDECMAASYLNGRVRIRQEPNSAAATLGFIEPNTVFPVLALISNPSGETYLTYKLKDVLVSSLTDGTGEQAGYSALDTLTLNGNCEQAVALLLPAVQKVREAAARSSAGGGPHVKVFDGSTGLLEFQFFDPTGPLEAAFLKLGDIKGESTDAPDDSLVFDDFTIGDPVEPQPILVGILYKIGKFLVTCCPHDPDQVDPGAGDDCEGCDPGGTGGDTDGDGQAFCEDKYVTDLAAAGAQAVGSPTEDGGLELWIVLPDGVEPPSHDCDDTGKGSTPKIMEGIADGTRMLPVPTSVQFPYKLGILTPDAVVLGDGSVKFGVDGSICMDLQLPGAPSACY
jgi:hypothetical protein